MKKLLLIALCLSLPLAACSKKAKTPPADNAATTKAKASAGRYLIFGTRGDPEYLDPGLISDNESSNIQEAISEGLVAYNPKGGQVLPGVATHWDLSKDLRTYTFHMRKNAKWSDGKAVTAGDFIYSWERVLSPATGSKYAFALYHIKNAKDYNKGVLTDPKQLGFKAIDDYTVQLELNEPTPYFLHLMAYPVYRPVPKWAVEKHGAKWTNAGNMVTNGPFTLESRVVQKEIRVKKDPLYWDAKNVKLPGIIFKPIEQVETALRMYEAGELDIDWYLPEKKLPTLEGREDYVMVPQLASYQYIINVNRKPFTDKRVRQALALGIDRKLLTEKYLHGTKLPSAYVTPPYIDGYKTLKGLEFDAARANKLLDDAGYTDRSTFPKFAIHYNTLESHKLIAQVVQQMWKQHLGIETTLFNEEWKTHLKTMNAETYDVARYGWIGDYPDPNTFLDLYTSYSTQNHTGWKNTAFDAKLEEAAKIGDQTKRWAKLAEAEAILLDEVPIIPIYAYTKSYMIRPYVKGYTPNLQDIHPYKGVYIDAAAAVAGQ